MEFKKSLLALGVLTVLSGCGSSDDDKKETPKPDTSEPPVVEVVTSDIKGVASKGTFINAPVYFYKYVDGAPVRLTEEELGAASTMTDDKGQYSAQVKVEGLVKVEIGVSQDINSPTYMICDAPAGCGQNAKGEAIAFGEQINMTVKDPTFTLTSLISAAKNDDDVQNTANITPLTHFAAALAEQRGDVSAESVSKAQSEIADTFGLIGALNELVPAKVEDQASLVDDDETDNLRYALINAGIAQALFAGSEGNVGDMSARLNSAIADLVAADGAFLVSRDNDDDAAFELTLEDILKGAEQATQQIIVLIKKDPVLSRNLSNIADFELLVTKLNNEVSKKKAESGDDGRSKGTETDTTEGDAVAKAAAMVNDVRVFANLFDVAKTSGKEVQTQGEEFVQLVEDAGTMVEQQADSFKLLGDVSEALSVIDTLRDAGKITEKTVQLDNYLALPGATGVVTLDEDGLTFNVQASAGEESLSAKAAVTSNEANTEYSLSLDGTIENAAAKFTLKEGTKVSVTLNEAVTREQLTSDTFDLDEHGIEAVKGELNLELTLAQKKTDEVTNPVSFSGKLSAELVPVITQELSYYNNLNVDGIYAPSFETDTMVLPKMLGLSGNFSSLEGNSIGASLTVNLANAENYQAAGFSYYGKQIEDVALLTIESDTKAVIKQNDGELVSTFNLLRSGEAGTLNFQVEVGDVTETVWADTFENVKYFLKQVTYGEDGGFSKSFYRIIAADGYYTVQTTVIHGSVEEFNNGQITLDGVSSNVNDLNWNDWFSSDSLDYILDEAYLGFIKDPKNINNIYDVLLQQEYQRSTLVKDAGVAFANIPDVKPELGVETSLSGRLVIEESDSVYKVSVSETGDQVTGVLNGFSRSYTFNKEEDGSFVFVRTEERQGEYLGTWTETFSALQNSDENGQHFVFYTDESHIYYNYQEDDADNDGVDIPPPEPEPAPSISHYYFVPSSDGVAGNYEVYLIEDAILTEDNQLVDSDNQPIDYTQSTLWFSSFNMEYIIRELSPTNLSLFDDYPAIHAIKQDWNGAYFDDKGSFYFGFYNQYGEGEDGQPIYYRDLILPNASIDIPVGFDPVDTFELEDENTFLGISAALNVDVVLGDYAVDLTLSGQRTEYEQGEFDLDIKYVIPGSDAQRSFTVEYDTKTETLSAKNAEGVSLEIIEPEPVAGEEVDPDAEVEIGKIMVGEEVAATILKRGSIVLIKYTDGAIESL